MSIHAVIFSPIWFLCFFFLFVFAGGVVCPGANIAAKDPRSQSASHLPITNT